MKTCTKCGKTFEDSNFCPACGTEVKDAPKAENGYTESDIKDNKVFAFLSYLGPLFLVPILAAPKSKYALFLAELIIALPVELLKWVNNYVFNVIFSDVFDGWLNIIPNSIGFCVDLIGIAAGALGLVLAVIGIINAFQGKVNELPFIGKIKILK